MSNDLEKYFNGKKSICREERQYALFLYNKLLQWIDKPCTDDFLIYSFGLKEGVIIKNVAYEATYMRDFFYENRKERFVDEYNKLLKDKKIYKRSEWKNANDPTDREINNFSKRTINQEKVDERKIEKEENKKSFNYKLCEFLCNEPKESDSKNGPMNGEIINNIFLNKNLGQKNALEEKLELGKDPTVRSMMNSKPDISIYYECGRIKYLALYECKYVSSESKGENGSQRDIQNKICRFLCDTWLKEENIHPVIDNKIIRFIGNRNIEMKNEEMNKEIYINVEDLIPKEMNF